MKIVRVKKWYLGPNHYQNHPDYRFGLRAKSRLQIRITNPDYESRLQIRITNPDYKFRLRIRITDPDP